MIDCHVHSMGKEKTDEVLDAMDTVSFASSFALVALAELGDKTQLAAVKFSARQFPVSVLLGVVLAFALVDGLSALLGGALAALLPRSIDCLLRPLSLSLR